MIEQKEDQFVKCRFCGKNEKLQWVEEVNNELIRDRHCFKCWHWFGYVKKVNDPNCVRVMQTLGEREPELHHYYIQPDIESHVGFKGFGGSRFVIYFNDGRKVASKNLWHQGEIPKRFYKLLPVNARFGKYDEEI